MAAPQAGLSQQQIRQAQINGLELAFLSDSDKKNLLAKAALRG
ncbi:adenosine deaminase [Vibrio mimicus CAIM 602]|nr:adenosine deaminase [Vibrio mimicus CAIM 602]